MCAENRIPYNFIEIIDECYTVYTENSSIAFGIITLTGYVIQTYFKKDYE